VALHLGAALGQAVDLRVEPPVAIDAGRGFRILVYATDTTDPRMRRTFHSAEACEQMPIVPGDVEATVRRFANAGAPLFVFSSWPPEAPDAWRARVEGAAGGRLAELCLLQLPPAEWRLSPGPRDRGGGHTGSAGPQADLVSPDSRFQLTALFPRTLCRQDFLAHGFAGGPGAGLHHSQLYIFTPKGTPPPVLAEELGHKLGAYTARMREDRRLAGVRLFRDVGLAYACCPDDLVAPLPEPAIKYLRAQLRAGGNGASAAPGTTSLHSWLRLAVTYAEGRCREQLVGLLAG